MIASTAPNLFIPSRSTADEEARSLCAADLLKDLKLIKPERTVVATLILWSQLLGAWLVALFGPPIFWIPAFVINCACVSAMQLWVHEGSHFNLFPNRKLNDLWATIFFASPIGVSLRAYRRFHITHHARLSTTKDMDRFAFNTNIRGNMQLLTFFTRTFVRRGLEACRDKISEP